MPSFKKLFPSNYIKAADLDGEELPLVIDRLALEYVGQGNEAEEKPVLYFRDHDQALVLNITNANAIADQYGEDYEGWAGKSITLYPTRVQFGAQMVDCLRVKNGQHSPKKKAATARKKDDDGLDLDALLEGAF
jgi:hypothetical protein